MIRKSIIASLIGLTLAATVSFSQESQDDQIIASMQDVKLEEILKVKIRTVETLAFHPKLVSAVHEQNTEQLAQDEILKRDEAWKNNTALTPFKRSLQTSQAGKVLKRLIASNPSFNEAFLTDNQGANVAAFPATSDYWQGDEEKWSQSFNNGDGRIFVGPLERDESTQTIAVQISAPVYSAIDASDDTEPEVIGVLVVGIALNYLEQKAN